jgi:hypothetical protein
LQKIIVDVISRRILIISSIIRTISRRVALGNGVFIVVAALTQILFIQVCGLHLFVDQFEFLLYGQNLSFSFLLWSLIRLKVALLSHILIIIVVLISRTVLIIICIDV